MIFNSLTFVVFFAAVLAAYWAIPSWGARKNILLGASYLFYAAWNPPFVLLLVLSTLIDHPPRRPQGLAGLQPRR
jgi:D-alanyl-lipoteichoic acid acyltransferase DltB (MBOAT superfamily)